MNSDLFIDRLFVSRDEFAHVKIEVLSIKMENQVYAFLGRFLNCSAENKSCNELRYKERS